MLNHLTRDLPTRLDLVAPFAVCALLVSPRMTSAAQPGPPTGNTGAEAPATSGATELSGQGKFATGDETPKPDEESSDATDLTLSAGGILSSGNARSAAVTGSVDFRLRRQIHQFSTSAAGNYAAAAVDDTAAEDNGFDQTVGNVQGRVRYDVFFHPRWSTFVMATVRTDTFQGLDLRLNVDPGLSFYAINKPKHRMWFEAGYDFQYDVRTDAAIHPLDASGDPELDEAGNATVLDKTASNHAVRLFAGYSNELNERVTFRTGVEYMQSFLDGKMFRVNWDNAFTTQIAGSFSLSATLTFRYDHAPLPGIETLDTVSALSVVYQLP